MCFAVRGETPSSATPPLATDPFESVDDVSRAAVHHGLLLPGRWSTKAPLIWPLTPTGVSVVVNEGLVDAGSIPYQLATDAVDH